MTSSFTYGSRQIKKLLTTAGQILEIYIYHEAKKSGDFNDIAGGLEVDWGDNKGISAFIFHKVAFLPIK